MEVKYIMKFTIELNSTELTNTILNGTLLALTESASNTDINAVVAAKITQYNNKKEEKLETEEKIEDNPEIIQEEIIENPDPEQSEEDKESITIEDVRAAFMAKNSKTNAPKLKALLNDFGVKKVTDLKESDFPKVIEALEAI